MAGGGVSLITLAPVANTEDILGHTLTSSFDITIASGTYPTNGYTLDPNNLGQLNRYKVVTDIFFSAKGAGALGYLFQYDTVNKSMRIFLGSGSTPAGTISVPAVTVTGSQSSGAGLQILPDSNAGVLGKTTATTVTIPGATFGIGNQTFTGTPGSAAAGVEVSGTFGGTTVIVRARFFGF